MLCMSYGENILTPSEKVIHASRHVGRVGGLYTVEDP